jgi:inosine-uridine nucleoside N-ribohydrolase
VTDLPARVRRVLIDTDPGLDDLLALALAAASPELEIAGLTTVAGNAPLEVVTDNAARFCALAGFDVPLGRGAARPLALPPGDATHFHGPDGRCGLELPDPGPRPTLSAHELLRTCLTERRIDAVIALGPLTNLGPLAAEHPEWFEGIPVVWMGGSLSAGNVTAVAEFNCWADPHAAHLVLDSGIEVRVLGLDVTRCAAVRESALAAARFGSGERARFAAGVLARLADAEQLGSGQRCAVLHDPAAIAAALEPELFRWEKRCLSVSLADGPERGRLSDLPGARESRVRWASEVRAAALLDSVLARLRSWSDCA